MEGTSVLGCDIVSLAHPILMFLRITVSSFAGSSRSRRILSDCWLHNTASHPIKLYLQQYSFQNLKSHMLSECAASCQNRLFVYKIHSCLAEQEDISCLHPTHPPPTHTHKQTNTREPAPCPQASQFRSHVHTLFLKASYCDMTLCGGVAACFLILSTLPLVLIQYETVWLFLWEPFWYCPPLCASVL